MLKQAIFTSAALLAVVVSGCFVQSTPRRQPAQPPQPPAAQPPAQPPAAQPPAAQPPVRTPPPTMPVTTPPPPPPANTTIPNRVPPPPGPGQIKLPGGFPPAPPPTPQCDPPLKWNGTACVQPNAGPPGRPPWQCPNGQHLEGNLCVTNHPPVAPPN